MTKLDQVSSVRSSSFCEAGLILWGCRKSVRPQFFCNVGLLLWGKPHSIRMALKCGQHNPVRVTSFCETRPLSLRTDLILRGQFYSVRPELILWSHTSFCEAWLHSVIKGLILWGWHQSVRIASSPFPGSPPHKIVINFFWPYKSGLASKRCPHAWALLI